MYPRFSFIESMELTVGSDVGLVVGAADGLMLGLDVGLSVGMICALQGTISFASTSAILTVANKPIPSDPASALR